MLLAVCAAAFLSTTPPNWAVPTAHAAGTIAAMRISVSLLWPDAYDPSRRERNSAQFQLAYGRPPEFRSDRSLFESDGDPWGINVVGHGLFGSEIYQRSRRCGHSAPVSAAFTAAVTVFWEYGVEAFHKQPSGVDLLWTPIAGVAVGEGRFQLHRLLERGGGEAPGLGRQILLFVLDPFGESERRLFKTPC